MRSGKATHWRNSAHFGSRADFKGKVLVLQRVTEGDKGTFTCRVEFKFNPTLTYRVNLTIIGK